MKLKDISRTATFAWDPSSASEPLIVTGAVAGALDESFSNDSQLEIWAPKLYERDGAESQGYSLGGQGAGPKGSVTVSSRFNRLAWSQPEAGASGRGIIAAGLETGEVNLYDPVKIFEGGDALIYKNDKHTGPVRGLHWNPLKKNLLLSGGVNAELYIHNLESLGDPIPPGPVSTKLGEITSLAWNPSVASVFAASSSSGFTSIWDLRHSKEIAALQYGGGAAKGDHTSGRAGTQIGKRRGMSDLCWHPEQATRLVTASEDDESPIVMMWDLRNTRAPERILSGHTKGVLSVAWCKQDADLLASCGKDNRTILWNPQSGEIVGELAPTTDWSFETAWCPSNPNLLAVASFDGHIGINSLQSTGPKDPEENKLAADASADDIFANLGTTSTSDDKTNAQSLTKAPKWMYRPCSASWGYGGVLASVSNLPSAAGKHQSSVVHLRHVVTEESIIDRAKSLDEIAGNKEKLSEFSSSKAENPSWKALQSLFQANSRDELVSLLGFSKENVARQVDELVKKLVPTIVEEPPEPSKDDTTPKSESKDPLESGDHTPEAKSSRALFAGDDRPMTPADVGGDTDFFSSMATSSLRNPQLDSIIPHLNQPTDSSVAATVGSGPSSVRSESIKENVFRIYPAGESDTDRLITQALVLGDFSSAVNLCLASERFADALLLAVRGGPELLQSTQKAYFTRRTLAHPFLRVYQSIVTEDLADIVQNADLAEWKVAFVVLCTYAKEADFANLADQLGRRLQFKWQLLTGSDSPEAKAEAKAARLDATLCYLAARNLEHVVSIWINEMQEEEASIDAPRYSAHANALQSFIEKVIAFQAATGYIDKDVTAKVPPEEAGARSYALAGLYDRFYEYADLLATQGLVDVAAKYIKMTPKDYRGSDGHQFDKARSRVFTAAGISDSAAVSTSTAFGRQPATAGPSSGSRHKPSASISSRYPSAPGFQPNAYASSSPYAAQSSPYTQPSGPYGASAPARGPSPSVPTGPYAPPPTSGPYAPPPSSQPAGPYGPATTSAPSNPYAPPPGVGGSSQFNAQPSAYGAGPNSFQPASNMGSNGYDQSQVYNPYGGSNYNAPAPSAPPLGPPPRATEHKEPIVPASQRRDIPGWNDAPSLAAPKRDRGSASSTPKPQPITSPFPMSEQAPSGPFPPTSSTPPPRAPPGGPPGVLPPPPKGGPRPPSAAKSPAQAPYGLPPQQQFGAPMSPPQQQQFGAPMSPPQQHAPSYAPPPKAGPPPPRSAPRAGPPPVVLAGPPPRALSPLGPGNRAAEQRPQPLGTFSPPPMAGPPPSGVRAGPPPPGRAGPRPPSHTPTPPNPPSPVKASHPPGDRSHMGDKEKQVFEALSAEFARIKQVNPNASGTVKKVIEDTERRLNILYDELNNDRIPDHTVDRISQITQAIKGGDAGSAMHMHTDLLTSATTEVAHWAPGIKQLIRLGLTAKV
ncbi:hypothetical protein CC85DRAFT_76158 [Cutaneotrichosporon oleaginosum]|uniref:Protein transport protein SEC31 n=1 Tax=Cutaneotrichosporon oleaginosum TaxID=879819 RepID=A0A0J0XP09_9TREE|nr:uncharacterized protein CC85DRAFT_76158 [Cutaneotrichosporon oleaginosum]KLT42853.1 hypothetical protein CC85DRAFT_76158 [Cutaneotrichosporon oleaginosum]TXT08182.1 hypothetical protein COLE_05106 [Cutaneotrichosporon oleaginosum]